MTVEVSEIIRSQRRTLALIVKPDGTLIVRAPRKASAKSIREFVEKNIEWIHKKQAQVRSFVPQAPKRYVQGEHFLYLGSSYPLEIVPDLKPVLQLNGGFKLAEHAKDLAVVEFERWYRVQAKEILKERVDFFARQYGFHYTGLKINAARTRWGSCSAKRSLNFSWRLIMAPMKSVDYVVLHELVHTVIHNHSRQFWNKVEKIMPDYKVHRQWLKKHGPELML